MFGDKNPLYLEDTKYYYNISVCINFLRKDYIFADAFIVKNINLMCCLSLH